MTQRIVVLALVLVAMPRMSAAQARDWDDLADEIARNVERQAEQIARNVERQAEQVARFFEQRYEAQRGRGRNGRNFGRGPEFTEPFMRTVRLGRTGTFDLQNVSGDIVVTGAGGDDVRIEATKRVRHPNETEARTILSEIEIQVQERSGRVEVRTEYPRRRNWSGGVDFTVSVPRDASVSLRSVSGTVKVSNINGELRAESVSGDIITSATRKLRMTKTVSGNLEISDAEADELSASSVSGDVNVNRLKASGFDAQTVSADLRLTDIDVDHASMRSVSGDIEYAGRLARTGRYQFQSHSGDVRVTPVDARGFTIEASTFSGDVRSDYALTLQGLPGNSLVPAGRNRSVRGSFGDAGATLMLQSFSGDIVIVKR
jgi:Putative adhesin